MMSLSGKVALVTGATSGIGKAVGVGFAEAGASLMLIGRDPDRGDRSLESIRSHGAPAELVLGDVADAAVCERAVTATVERFGRIDVLVNGAGVIYRGDALETPDDAWRRSMAINVDAVFYLSRAAVRVMKSQGGGSIVNIASNVGLVGCHGLAAYCATKGAVVQLTRAMALDHAKDGVRVNAVCPGAVDTPMLVSGHERSGLSDEDVLRRNADAIPQGRVATSQEVAALVLFLACDGSRHITGTAIPIDGGYTAE